MGLFFGTDGIRGKFNEDLNHKTAFRFGNALGSKNQKAKVLIGKDTRGTGSILTLAFSCGLLCAGANVVDVGVCPTAGVSYLVKKLGFDFGVVVSASHNPAEFNGIKILNEQGLKLGDDDECEIERNLLKTTMADCKTMGKFSSNPTLVKKYKEFLQKSITTPLSNKTIVLDCANGAACGFAPEVFRKNGAKVIVVANKPNGLNINKNCGATHIQNLKNSVLKTHADMGFAFDGDSDRVIAVDENGNVVDGDKILYALACDYFQKGKLNGNAVVGTILTNKGIEVALCQKGIELLRVDVGDKHVSEKLKQNNLIVGGEQSGHIIIKDKHVTGDGILVALHLAEMCASQNKKLSNFFDFKLFEQTAINVKVSNKEKIIKNPVLNKTKIEQESLLGDHGRIILRVSGTEPVVRVMVESECGGLSKDVAEKIANVVKMLDMENNSCVE